MYDMIEIFVKHVHYIGDIDSSTRRAGCLNHDIQNNFIQTAISTITFCIMSHQMIIIGTLIICIEFITEFVSSLQFRKT